MPSNLRHDHPCMSSLTRCLYVCQTTSFESLDIRCSRYPYALEIYQIIVKNEVYKNGYRRRSCTSKTSKIHRFVTFVMYWIFSLGVQAKKIATLQKVRDVLFHLFAGNLRV